jgi:hypothetical protein
VTPPPRREEPVAPPPPPPPQVRQPPVEPVLRETLRETPTSPGARGGWLSDLLARASRDDEPPAAPRRPDLRPSLPPERPAAPAPAPSAGRGIHANAIESLGSLSADIARMIDHDAAVELWERYTRGETNVFTRRLYTLQGQERFDEFRRRYRRDAEFRDTVDAYVDKFEELLREVAPGDRDSMLAKSILTSDEGKVYTILAHASGKFD